MTNSDEINEDLKDEDLKDEDLKEIVPAMNVNTSLQKTDDGSMLISDEALLGVYSEIMNNIRNDYTEIDGVLTNFVDMVVNQGDSTTSSKEALVNLLKLKVDQSDKMARVADLMTRIKLKDKDTFPRYLAASQQNTININSGSQKRAIINALKNVKIKEQNDDTET
jgi:hypothetical protein